MALAIVVLAAGCRPQGEVPRGQSPPDEAPDGIRFDVEIDHDDAELHTGAVLLAVKSDPWDGIVAVDGTGAPVWWSRAPPGWEAAAPRLTLDGRAVLYLLNDDDRVAEDQRLVRVELDGSGRTEWPVFHGHHMVAELDDGFAWLAWDIRDVPWTGSTPETVLSDRVLRGPGDGTTTELLSFFDDRGPTSVPCRHGIGTEQRLGRFVHEWTHANSLVSIPERGALIVVARFLDAILELDADTGEVRWQAGGHDATRRIGPADDVFAHGHLSDAWDGGLLMFDNGGHDATESRVVEYTVDDDGLRATWSYADPTGRRTLFLGDARRLPGDHVLVAWATDGRIDEVDRDGLVRWRLRLDPPEAVVGRIRYLETAPR